MNRIIRMAAVAGCLIILFRSQIFAEPKDTYIDDSYVDLCQKYAEEYDLCPEILEALIETESGGKAHAVSGKNCVGLCQINPKYSEYTYDELLDPETNIKECARILHEYSNEYEIADALVAYNCGVNSKTFKKCHTNGTAIYNRYAKKILKRSQELEELHYGY